MFQGCPAWNGSPLVMALEPRLMFDGAARADAVDAVAPMAETTEPRVLLLSSAVADGDDLAAAATNDVLVVRYDAQADSLDAILARVSDALDGRQASSIALASHGADGGFELVSGHDVSLASIVGDVSLQDFMRGPGNRVAEGGRIDVLACDVAGTTAGQYLLSYLSDLSGRTVTASDDPTGNAAAGGDWDMEAGGIDAAAYFDTAALASFDGVLAIGMIKDIKAGGSSGPYALTEFKGELYFRADDGVHGIELWKSDGTEAGTVMVKNINLTEGASLSYFANAGGKLYFQADDGVHGGEIWTSDGTEAGTFLAKDVRTGASGGGAMLVTNVGGKVYFMADDGIHGAELWGGVAEKPTTAAADTTQSVGHSPPESNRGNGRAESLGDQRRPLADNRAPAVTIIGEQNRQNASFQAIAFGRADNAAPSSPSNSASPLGGNAFRASVIPARDGASDAALITVNPVSVVDVSGTQVNFTLPADTFATTRGDAQIQLAATQLDGTALPGWLASAPRTGTFVGQPPSDVSGEVVVRVIARDQQGNEAVATVRINVTGGGDAQSPAEPAPQPGQSGAAAPINKFAGKPSFQDELRLASRLSGARQAQLPAAARAVALGA